MPCIINANIIMHQCGKNAICNLHIVFGFFMDMLDENWDVRSPARVKRPPNAPEFRHGLARGGSFIVEWYVPEVLT